MCFNPSMIKRKKQTKTWNPRLLQFESLVYDHIVEIDQFNWFPFNRVSMTHFNTRHYLIDALRPVKDFVQSVLINISAIGNSRKMEIANCHFWQSIFFSRNLFRLGWRNVCGCYMHIPDEVSKLMCNYPRFMIKERVTSFASINKCVASVWHVNETHTEIHMETITTTHCLCIRKRWSLS